MKRMLTSLLLLAAIQPAFAQRKSINTDNSATTISMTQVGGGSFEMGSDKFIADYRPAHKVTLKDFSISTFEITQEQWEKIMGSNPSQDKCGKCPVTNVSWNDVQAFIEKLNALTGKHYRLPTEAEWEYAALGGDKMRDTRYSGKNFPQTVGWFDGNAKGRIHEIGMKKPNELGIYDMSGNAEEWCADYYAKGYGSPDDVTDPQGPSSGNARIVRGGSWRSDASEMSVEVRKGYTPDTKTEALGFRLVEDR